MAIQDLQMQARSFPQMQENIRRDHEYQMAMIERENERLWYIVRCVVDDPVLKRPSIIDLFSVSKSPFNKHNPFNQDGGNGQNSDPNQRV